MGDSLDIKNSWLSDHPLIQIKPTKDLKLGVFNVLSNIASDTKINSHLIKQHPEINFFYSAILYLDDDKKFNKILNTHFKAGVMREPFDRHRFEENGEIK